MIVVFNRRSIPDVLLAAAPLPSAMLALRLRYGVNLRKAERRGVGSVKLRSNGEMDLFTDDIARRLSRFPPVFVYRGTVT
jgi:hypothetical protein